MNGYLSGTNLSKYYYDLAILKFSHSINEFKIILNCSYSVFVPPRQFQHLEYGGPNDPGIISYVVKGVSKDFLGLHIKTDKSLRLSLFSFVALHYVIRNVTSF